MVLCVDPNQPQGISGFPTLASVLRLSAAASPECPTRRPIQLTLHPQHPGSLKLHRLCLLHPKLPGNPLMSRGHTCAQVSHIHGARHNIHECVSLNMCVCTHTHIRHVSVTLKIDNLV